MSYRVKRVKKGIKSVKDEIIFEGKKTKCTRYYEDAGHSILHRENGPAVEFDDGYEAWYVHGILHREDGPARTWPDGLLEFYYKGERILVKTTKEFLQLMKLKAFW